MEELHLLPEFIREGASSPEELDTQYNKVLKMIEELEMRNMLRSEEDHLGAIMEINSGAGGTESLDWAAMLMRMYMRWGEANGYQVKVIDVQDGEEVGIKSATSNLSANSPTDTSKAKAASTVWCALTIQRQQQTPNYIRLRICFTRR